jgi:hypothetical protein
VFTDSFSARVTNFRLYILTPSEKLILLRYVNLDGMLIDVKNGTETARRDSPERLLRFL